MSDLKYFTQAAILQQIGHRRLARLLNAFDADLNASNLVLPHPDTQNGNYFSELADALALPQRLPESLRKALFTLEEAASPENETRIWAAIKRRIPGVCLSEDCPLDRVLELWFAAPDEFPALRVHSLSASGGEGRGEVVPHSALCNPQSAIDTGEAALSSRSTQPLELLAAIRDIFHQSGATRITSQRLVESLRNLQPSTLNFQLDPTQSRPSFRQQLG